MPQYTIIPKAERDFHVAIVGEDGARQTILGFETLGDAQAWIARDAWQRVTDDPWMPGSFRTSVEV